MTNSVPRKTIFCRLLLASVCLAVPAGAEEPPLPKINPDGTWVESPWGKPVIDRGKQGDWDHAAVDNPYVFSEADRYYCFYEGQDKPTNQSWHEQTGLAVSEDGRTWVKRQGNPILDVGPLGSWDAAVAKLPAGVIKHSGRYYLFYSGRDRSDMKRTTKQIGLATARRPTGPWTKWPGNPVLRSRGDQWDRHISTQPAPVFELGGRFFLLYRGMRGFYHDQGLGVAVSGDLIHWTRVAPCDRRPVISADEEICSLSVARSHGRYVGIAQPFGRHPRRYWYSDDLVRWTPGPTVKFRASIQAETLSNPFLVAGRWTVLYEQKDRIYRAVLK